MILGLSHVGLTVSNLERSLDYYQQNFGFKVLSDAERKGDWIEKMTGIPGFHSRTVYLSVTSFHHMEIFDFIYPKAIPPESDANLSAGVVCCVFLKERQAGIPALGRPMTRDRWVSLIGERESSFRGGSETIWEDPDAMPLKIIHGVKEGQDHEKQIKTDLLYPIFLTDHISRSLAFYQDLLGLEVNDEGSFSVEPGTHEKSGFKGTMRWVLLGTKTRPCVKLVEPLDLKIHSASPWQMQKIGFSHAAFGVTHLDEYYLELNEKGVDFRSFPQSVTLGPHQGGKAVYLNTPDGIVLEFIDSPRIQQEIRELKPDS
jgi:catechol 2,3-dioxygenase-like lactoylglutathione lyase family enzyme